MRLMNASSRLWTLAVAGALLTATPDLRLLAQEAQAQPAATPAAQPSILIAPGDMIEILVFDTPELSGKLRVSDSGEIRLPVGGTVVVAGLSPEQASIQIEDKLRNGQILKDPHVAVLVSEYVSTSVTVIGEVKTPGTYTLLGAHDLIEVLGTAGGLTNLAGRDITVIHASDPKHPEVLTDILGRDNKLAGDIRLQPGDKVIVSKSGVVYVLGDVGRPGGFVLDRNDGLTILQSLSLAQGVNRTAKQKNAVVIRKQNGVVTHYGMDLDKVIKGQTADMKLENGDVLYVPPSNLKTFGYRGLEAAIQTGTGVLIYRR